MSNDEQEKSKSVRGLWSLILGVINGFSPAIILSLVVAFSLGREWESVVVKLFLLWLIGHLVCLAPAISALFQKEESKEFAIWGVCVNLGGPLLYFLGSHAFPVASSL